MSGTKGLSETALAKGKLFMDALDSAGKHRSFFTSAGTRKKRKRPARSKRTVLQPKKWKIPEHCVYPEQVTEKHNGSPGQCQGSWNPPFLSQKKAKMRSTNRRTGKTQLQYLYCPSTVWVRAALSSLSPCIMHSVYEFWGVGFGFIFFNVIEFNFVCVCECVCVCVKPQDFLSPASACSLYGPSFVQDDFLLLLRQHRVLRKC